MLILQLDQEPHIKRKLRSSYLAPNPAWMGHMVRSFKSWTMICTAGIPARRRNGCSLQLTVIETLFQSREEPDSWGRRWTRWFIPVFPHCFSCSVKQPEQVLLHTSSCLLGCFAMLCPRCVCAIYLPGFSTVRTAAAVVTPHKFWVS